MLNNYENSGGFSPMRQVWVTPEEGHKAVEAPKASDKPTEEAEKLNPLDVAKANYDAAYAKATTELKRLSDDVNQPEYIKSVARTYLDKVLTLEYGVHENDVGQSGDSTIGATIDKLGNKQRQISAILEDFTKDKESLESAQQNWLKLLEGKATEYSTRGRTLDVRVVGQHYLNRLKNESAGIMDDPKTAKGEAQELWNDWVRDSNLLEKGGTPSDIQSWPEYAAEKVQEEQPEVTKDSLLVINEGTLLSEFSSILSLDDQLYIRPVDKSQINRKMEELIKGTYPEIVSIAEKAILAPNEERKEIFDRKLTQLKNEYEEKKTEILNPPIQPEGVTETNTDEIDSIILDSELIILLKAGKESTNPEIRALAHRYQDELDAMRTKVFGVTGLTEARDFLNDELLRLLYEYDDGVTLILQAALELFELRTGFETKLNEIDNDNNVSQPLKTIAKSYATRVLTDRNAIRNEIMNNETTPELAKESFDFCVDMLETEFDIETAFKLGGLDKLETRFNELKNETDDLSEAEKKQLNATVDFYKATFDQMKGSEVPNAEQKCVVIFARLLDEIVAIHNDVEPTPNSNLTTLKDQCGEDFANAETDVNGRPDEWASKWGETGISAPAELAEFKTESEALLKELSKKDLTYHGSNLRAPGGLALRRTKKGEPMTILPGPLEYSMKNGKPLAFVRVQIEDEVGLVSLAHLKAAKEGRAAKPAKVATAARRASTPVEPSEKPIDAKPTEPEAAEQAPMRTTVDGVGTDSSYNSKGEKTALQDSRELSNINSRINNIIEAAIEQAKNISNSDEMLKAVLTGVNSRFRTYGRLLSQRYIPTLYNNNPKANDANIPFEVTIRGKKFNLHLTDDKQLVFAGGNRQAIDKIMKSGEESPLNALLSSVTSQTENQQKNPVEKTYKEILGLANEANIIVSRSLDTSTDLGRDLSVPVPKVIEFTLSGNNQSLNVKISPPPVGKPNPTIKYSETGSNVVKRVKSAKKLIQAITTTSLS